jgi:hypothetical protein
VQQLPLRVQQSADLSLPLYALGTQPLGLLLCALAAPGSYPSEVGALDISRRYHIQRAVERATNENRHTIPSSDDCSCKRSGTNTSAGRACGSSDLPVYDKVGINRI